MGAMKTITLTERELSILQSALTVADDEGQLGRISLSSDTTSRDEIQKLLSKFGMAFKWQRFAYGQTLGADNGYWLLMKIDEEPEIIEGPMQTTRG